MSAVAQRAKAEGVTRRHDAPELANYASLIRSNGGFVPLNEINLAGMGSVTLSQINLIAQHLADAGYIEWKPYLSGGGIARIKGSGIDVIEGTMHASINITLPKQEPAPSNPQRGLNAAVRSTTEAVEPILPPPATPQMSSLEGGATIHVPHTVIGAAVLQNKIQIGITAASLSALIDERIASLKSELPNSEDAQAARDQSVADYERLKTGLEALRNAALEFAADSTKEEKVVEASKSFADGVADWWTQRHAQICEQAYDIGLFTLAVGVGSLAGSGGELAVAVSGVLVKGKPVVDAIKALFQKK